MGKSSPSHGCSYTNARTRSGAVRGNEATLFRVGDVGTLTDGVFSGGFGILAGKWHVVEVEWISSSRSSHTSTKRIRGGTGVVGWVNRVGVVEPLRTTEVSGGVDVYIGVRLDDPDEFFTRVVEVKFDFVTGRVNRFVTGELELFDKVFVGNLSESSSFISV